MDSEEGKTKDVDILLIDQDMHKFFNQRKDSLPILREKIQILQKILKDSKIHNETRLRSTLAEYEEKLLELENDSDYYFYISETAKILEEYKIILKTPVKMSFFGANKEQATVEARKFVLKDSYIQICKKYNPSLDVCLPVKSKKFNHLTVTCDDCKGKNLIMTESSAYVCVNCGIEKEVAE